MSIAERSVSYKVYNFICFVSVFVHELLLTDYHFSFFFHFFTQKKKTDKIWESHHTVENIGYRPYILRWDDRTHRSCYRKNQREADPDVVPWKIDKCRFSAIVPANYSAESENCHKCGCDISGRTACDRWKSGRDIVFSRSQHCQGGKCTAYHCVEEYLEHTPHSLSVRRIAFCCAVKYGRTSKTGFIREYTSPDTCWYCFWDAVSRNSADSLSGSESLSEYGGYCAENTGVMSDDNA